MERKIRVYHNILNNLFTVVLQLFGPVFSPCTTFTSQELRAAFWWNCFNFHHSTHPLFNLPSNRYIQSFDYAAIFWLCASRSSFRRLSCASEGMTLSAATLRNLEILNNQVQEAGSFSHCLNIMVRTHLQNSAFFKLSCSEPVKM